MIVLIKYKVIHIYLPGELNSVFWALKFNYELLVGKIGAVSL